MRNSVLKFLSKFGPLLFLMLAVPIFVGCQGVALTNRTNALFAGNAEYEYYAENDIFIYGYPWRYELKIRDEYAVRASIQPNVVIDGVSHPMTLNGNWEGNVSYWTYDQEPECEDPSPPYASDSNYYFVVHYNPSNIFTSSSPARIPSSGSYTSHLVNLGGMHFEPRRPYFVTIQGVIYDQNCWDTGLGCVPTWKYEEAVYGWWPSQLEYRFVLRNTGTQDATITALWLGSLGLDTSSFYMFEIGNTNLPITVPACGGTADIILLYNPDSIPGYYTHSLMLHSMIQWADLHIGSVGGPFLWVDYEIYKMPS